LAVDQTVIKSRVLIVKLGKRQINYLTVSIKSCQVIV